MIGLPVNDYPCLSQIAELVSDLIRNQDPVLGELAQKYQTTDTLAAWIRSLPQRDDTADPSDGPRADECAPPQRLRIPAPDPNCVERAALYLAVAELIDPRPLRQLATIDTPAGRHTFVAEDGQPVVLDPTVTQNALEAGMFHIEGADGADMTPEQQIDWICAIAAEPAQHYQAGATRVRAAREAMRGALLGRSIPSRRLVDIAFTLALAAREAPLFGGRGVAVQRAVMNMLAATELAAAGSPRNAPNLELRVGHTTLRPDWGTLGALARVGGRLGGVAAQGYLASKGISPTLLAEVERELNREGLSLGPLRPASPALVGSLAALIG